MSTTEIERRPLTPLDIGQTKAAQKLYQDGLHQLLDMSEDVTAIRGRGGKVKNHVNRSGVSKITTWCSLSSKIQSYEIDRDENGKAIRWRVVVRAEASDGRVQDGIGAFDVKEHPSNKPEHDGLATASTRARNRAVMDLVGMGEVSAEEIVQGGGGDTDGTELPFGPEATLDLVVKVQEAIPAMMPGVPGDAAVKVFTNNFGYFPEVAGRTIMGMKWLAANPAPPAPAQAPPQAPVRSPEGTEPPPPAQPPTEPGPAARGPTATPGGYVAAGPGFDDMVTPADVVSDLDEVDIDGLLDDPSK